MLKWIIMSLYYACSVEWMLNCEIVRKMFSKLVWMGDRWKKNAYVNPFSNIQKFEARPGCVENSIKTTVIVRRAQLYLFPYLKKKPSKSRKRRNQKTRTFDIFFELSFSFIAIHLFTAQIDNMFCDIVNTHHINITIVWCMN